VQAGALTEASGRPIAEDSRDRAEDRRAALRDLAAEAAGPLPSELPARVDAVVGRGS
jgi:hypothetical protein